MSRIDYAIEVPEKYVGVNIAPPQMFFQGTMPFRKDKEGLRLLNPSQITLATYRQMMKHPGIRYPMELLKLPTLRSKFVYKNEDEDIQTFVREVMKKIWFRLKKDTLTGYTYGFSLQEKRFMIDNDGFMRYRRFRSLYPDATTLLAEKETGIFAGAKQKVRWGGGKSVFIPAVKLFLYTHDREFENLYGRSRCESAHTPWVVDIEAYKFQGLAQQDFSVPPLKARAPVGQMKFTTSGKRTETKMTYLDYVTMLAESIFSRGVVAIPSGVDFDITPLFEKKSVFWDFNKDHEMFDAEMAKGIFGFYEISGGKGGGSYAKAKEQGKWLIEGIEGLQEEQATEFFQPYIIEPLIYWNFFDGKTPPPLGEFQYSPMSRFVKEFLADVFMEVISNHPERVNLEELAEILNVPILEGGLPEDKRKEDEKGIPVFNNQREVQAYMKKCWRAGMAKVKIEEGISEFVPMPSEDLQVISQRSKDIIELQRKNKKGELLVEMQHVVVMGMIAAKNFVEERKWEM